MRRLAVGRTGARLFALLLLAGLLVFTGCPPYVTDHNAFQTGRVRGTAKVRISGMVAPRRGSVDIGLGRGWEIGAGFGQIWDWGLSGDVSLSRSLYSDQHLFSSMLFQAELAKRPDSLPVLSRVTAAAAAGFWPTDWFGIYVPIRLSMLFAKPVTFHYKTEVWDDSLGAIVIKQQELVFPGLRDPVLTPGLGFAAEYKWFSVRLACTIPVLGPDVSGDETHMGFTVSPYIGFQVGLRPN